jgi:flagellar M-ring protein FliF
MKFLNEFVKQMRDMFLSLTPAARFVAGILLAAIAVSTAFLFQGRSQNPTDYLFSGQSFKETEIQAMEVAFSKAGLRNYEVIGSRVKVPSTERDQYIKSLDDNDALPRTLNNGRERVDSSNPFRSARESELIYKERKQKDVADAISRMSGIVDATVEYSESKQGFGRQLMQSAVVLVTPQSGHPLQPEQMREIARVVSGAFSGLPAENVRVTDLSTGLGFTPDENALGGEEAPYLRQRRLFETGYKQRIRNTLNWLGDFPLEVEVILDDTIFSETEQLKFDPQPVTIETIASRKDVESTKASQGGRPGTEPNALGNKGGTLAGAPDQSSKTKESTENEKRIPGQEITRMAKAGLVPKRVSTSIGISDDFIRKTLATRWLQANPDKPTADMPPPAQADVDTLFKELENNINLAVAGILPPVAAGDDRFKLVSVYRYTEVPPDVIPPPAMTTVFFEFLQESWQTLGLFMLVLVAMGMVVSMSRAKSTAADDPFKDGFGIALMEKIKDNLDISVEEEEASGGEGETEIGPDGKRVRKVEVTGAELKESLSSMIQENPDAAVNLIRTWIGEAA